jgi:hypothetical protein
VRREASRQLREQIALEVNDMNCADLSRRNPLEADWTHIDPLLDEAMHALGDTDRTAVLLRYFENKSLREVGTTLGTSENAAQKRLGRAVERLRGFFAKRGVTVGASGLVVVISANGIQAAQRAATAGYDFREPTESARKKCTCASLDFRNRVSRKNLSAFCVSVHYSVETDRWTKNQTTNC